MYSVKRTVSTGDVEITTEVTFRTEGELLNYIHVNGIDADMDLRDDPFSNVGRSNNSGMHGYKSTTEEAK